MDGARLTEQLICGNFGQPDHARDNLFATPRFGKLIHYLYFTTRY